MRPGGCPAGAGCEQMDVLERSPCLLRMEGRSEHESRETEAVSGVQVRYDGGLEHDAYGGSSEEWSDLGYII